MSDLRTAAQHALEALEEATNYTGCEAWSPSMTDECLAVAVALKAALEQPEQEPVAWCDIEEDGTIHGLRYWSEPGRREHALYTHPPRREWRGLTEEEISALFPSHLRGDYKDLIPYSFARAVEAALRSKNYE
jgi:hypothetical protein